MLLAAGSLAVPAAASAQDSGTLPPTLTPTPQVPSTTTPSTTTPSTSQLPDTGLDARLFALLGLALLVSGIGLRMRTADEYF